MCILSHLFSVIKKTVWFQNVVDSTSDLKTIKYNKCYMIRYHILLFFTLLIRLHLQVPSPRELPSFSTLLHKHVIRRIQTQQTLQTQTKQSFLKHGLYITTSNPTFTQNRTIFSGFQWHAHPKRNTNKHLSVLIRHSKHQNETSLKNVHTSEIGLDTM